MEWVSFAEKRSAMKEVYFERICSMMLEGNDVREDMSYVLDNMFYERFGMSGREIYDQLSCSKS